MNILEAVYKIDDCPMSQRAVAEACHYAPQYFCELLGRVRKGREISPKAEAIITAYAEKLT